MQRFLPSAMLAITLISCGGASQTVVPTTPPESSDVHVKVLAINDFHGNLEGPSGEVLVDGVPVKAGGASHLAARIREIQKYHPHTIVVGAGDMIGASPLISALFHDEPAIEALNLAGLELNAVGNHEFDEGMDELARMQSGGCHPQDGCKDGDGFDGAKFKFLAANVTHVEGGATVFPAYEVREFDGVKMAFIGLTLENTPEILEPGAADGLEFHDEAETINAAVETIRGDGIEAIVVLIHEGGRPESKDDPSGCVGISGPILEIVRNVDDAVDLFVTGHTHQPYVCDIDGRLVTSGKAYGQLVTEIDLTLDRETGDVADTSASNLVVDRRGTPAEDVEKLVEKYRRISDPIANAPVGTITEDIRCEGNADGECDLGRLIADMQLAYSTPPERGGAQIAFMNFGGVRSPLEYAPGGDEAAGVVTFAEAHRVQPFGNKLVTMSVTGAELHELLEAQWKGQDKPRILLVSSGFEYQWSASAEAGEKVDPATMQLNGVPIDPNATYRITANSYLAGGGDRFEIFKRGRDRVAGPVDLDAFQAYFKANSPVAPPAGQRVKRVD